MPQLRGAAAAETSSDTQQAAAEHEAGHAALGWCLTQQPCQCVPHHCRSVPVALRVVPLPLQAYYGLSLAMNDLAGSVYLNQFLGFVVEFPAYLLVILVIDRLGRRFAISWSMLIGEGPGMCRLGMCRLGSLAGSLPSPSTVAAPEGGEWPCARMCRAAASHEGSRAGGGCPHAEQVCVRLCGGLSHFSHGCGQAAWPLSCVPSQVTGCSNPWLP